MYSKECPVEGCEVVLHDDDMDRLINHMKAHIKTHEEEDETEMESTTGEVVEDDEHFIPMMRSDEAVDELFVPPPFGPPSKEGVSQTPTPNIARALCAMQKADLGAITDSSNPFFGSRYADLSSVWGVIRKPLTDAGLSIMQYPEPYDGGITIITRLYHVSGEMFETRLSGKTDLDKTGKQTIQKLGSLITYLRRYSISMLVGVAPKDDDDGNVASNKPNTKKRGDD